MQEAGENLTLLAVKQGLAAGTLTVIDVREPAEFAAGHIPGSRNLPLSHFDPTALPVGAKRLVFACQTGKRATLARERFVAAGGDPSAALFLAGFAGWLAAGETIAR
jgi:rhodanese-related sulfurtransferase